MFVCRVCLYPCGNPASWWTVDFWSKSVSLILAHLKTFFCFFLPFWWAFAVMILAGGGSVAVAVGVSDRWQVSGDWWQMTGDTRHIKHNKWHLTCDTWHMTFYLFKKEIAPFCRLFSVFVFVWISAHIDRFSVLCLLHFSYALYQPILFYALTNKML